MENIEMTSCYKSFIRYYKMADLEKKEFTKDFINSTIWLDNSTTPCYIINAKHHVIH